MVTRQPVAEKLPSIPEHAEPTPWADALRRLENGRGYWLATARPDGAPHVRPVLAVWVDGALYFVATPSSRKARNLAHDPRCAISVEWEDAHLVVEGEATKVTEDATLLRVADVYASKYEWHVRVSNGAFEAAHGAPTAGPPPYEVYGLVPAKVFGFGFGSDDSWSPTRWRF